MQYIKKSGPQDALVRARLRQRLTESINQQSEVVKSFVHHPDRWLLACYDGILTSDINTALLLKMNGDPVAIFDRDTFRSFVRWFHPKIYRDWKRGRFQEKDYRDVAGGLSWFFYGGANE
jgi:hypothetical protein